MSPRIVPERQNAYAHWTNALRTAAKPFLGSFS
jgi:hypothetical protein